MSSRLSLSSSYHRQLFLPLKQAPFQNFSCLEANYISIIFDKIVWLKERKTIQFYSLIISRNKKNRPESLSSFHYNQTHGGTCLVLLPSRPDTLHKPTIVLAFRQRIVYLIFHSLTSLFLISFFADVAFGKSQSKPFRIRLLKCHLLHTLDG